MFTIVFVYCLIAFVAPICWAVYQNTIEFNLRWEMKDGYTQIWVDEGALFGSAFVRHIPFVPEFTFKRIIKRKYKWGRIAAAAIFSPVILMFAITVLPFLIFLKVKALIAMCRTNAAIAAFHEAQPAVWKLFTQCDDKLFLVCEEGVSESLMAHELTHIDQYQSGRYKSMSLYEMELEAAAAEGYTGKEKEKIARFNAFFGKK